MAKVQKGVRFVENSLINATVPKNRKPKFELALKIVDLNNVPLVSGTSYVKWHLPHSTAAEDRGKTHRATIKEHKVAWDYEKILQLRMTIDKGGTLQETEIQFEIIQEYASGARGERITLGHLRLNLAEYVDGSYESDESITRRYLMTDSKINSTIKLSIYMKQIEGDKNFTAPQLRTAPIFGGIAGIINTADKGEAEDGHIPAMSSKITRDIGEMQDMYRRTLTASYVSQIHELPADECIEDIFSGGDGWGNTSGHVLFRGPFESDDEDGSDNEHLAPPSHHRGNHSRHGSKDAHSRQNPSIRTNHKRDVPGAVGGNRSPNDHPAHSSSSDDHKYKYSRKANEVSELDVREDLRSWAIPAPES